MTFKIDDQDVARRLAEVLKRLRSSAPWLAEIIGENVNKDAVTIDFRQTWPDWVYEPPGLVGDVARWMVEDSRCKQRKFALAASLAVLGHFLGRRVREPSGQYANVYALAIGPTSCGKTDALDRAEKLEDALGGTGRLLGEIKLGPQLEDAVNAYSVRLALWDEVGPQIAAMKKASDGPHVPGLASLTRMWSCAGKPYKMRQRARSSEGVFNEAKVIDRPFCAVYATGTPRTIYEALSSRDFDSGDFPRWLVFVSDERRLGEDVEYAPVPVGIINALRSCGYFYAIPDKFEDKPFSGEARVIPCTDAARSVFKSFDELRFFLTSAMGDETSVGLAGKVVENAKRIALTVAVLRSKCGSAVIDRRDAEYGCAVAWLCFCDFFAKVEENVADTERERIRLALEKIIKAAGPHGLTLTEINRKTRRMFDKRDRDEALEAIAESEEFAEAKSETDGRYAVRYFFQN